MRQDSSRGGKPGFVRIDGDRALISPDFVVNFHSNTIGNLLLNLHAGLLFVDFDPGNLLYYLWQEAQSTLTVRE